MPTGLHVNCIRLEDIPEIIVILCIWITSKRLAKPDIWRRFFVPTVIILLGHQHLCVSSNVTRHSPGQGHKYSLGRNEVPIWRYHCHPAHILWPPWSSIMEGFQIEGVRTCRTKVPNFFIASHTPWLIVETAGKQLTGRWQNRQWDDKVVVLNLSPQSLYKSDRHSEEDCQRQRSAIL